MKITHNGTTIEFIGDAVVEINGDYIKIIPIPVTIYPPTYPPFPYSPPLIPSPWTNPYPTTCSTQTPEWLKNISVHMLPESIM